MRAKDIAALLGRTEKSVYNRLAAAGAGSSLDRKFSAEEDDAVMAGIMAGRTLREIALGLGRSTSGVAKRAERLADPDLGQGNGSKVAMVTTCDACGDVKNVLYTTGARMGFACSCGRRAFLAAARRRGRE
jgi:hypothetical protein